MDPLLRVHAASDPGRKRSRNEDCHAVCVPGGDEARARRGALLVVADGLGGALAGDVASRMAVEAVVRCFESADVADPLDCLRESIATANREVHAAARSRPDWLGMGTTLTAVLVRGAEAWVAHVGDSRAYLVRDGHCVRLTEDHPLAAGERDADGRVTARCIGPRPSVEADASRLEEALLRGDSLVLCSDGLHDLVDDRELAALAANPSLEKGCRDLIELANRRGGPDNITVVVARLEAATVAAGGRGAPPAPGSGGRAPRHAGSPARIARFVLPALAIAVLGLAGWLALIGR